MASSFARKYLVCFYCNKKSNIKYDGLVKQWECGNCQAMNYLDENGDITDPPVATDCAAPVDRLYTVPRSGVPPSSQESDAAAFCSTCLKNQHLLTASLAQYDIELDPRNPQYKENERNYYRYRKGLEKRYPQVCEDCEPKALEKMREAGKTAKTDYLRRLMQKSRARRSTSSEHGISMESVGHLLWYLGLLGQLLWHFIAISANVQRLLPSALQHYLPQTRETFLSRFTGLSAHFSIPGLVRLSLLCSFASVWWNPKFKQMKTGFMNHIKGFREWYQYQVLLLVIRSLCYFLMGTGVMADPYATSTITAHAFISGFILYLAVAAHRSFKVDMTPLWASTPEKLPHVGPRTSPSPTNPTGSMADLLDQIGATPSRGFYQTSPSSSPPYNSQQGVVHIYGKPKSQIELQPRNQPSSSIRNDMRQMDEMDWSPSQSQSEHRAFAPSSQRNADLFGQTPVASNTSPFWYKVPPAPITPAQRLRNPPNQPRLRVSSQEVKENFFNNVTRRNIASDLSSKDAALIGIPKSRHEVEFAQPKFFPKAPPSEAGEALSDLLTSFSLNSSEDEILAEIKQPSRMRHIYQGLALLLGLILWNQVLSHPFEQTRNVLLVIMLGCFFIGLRTILDNALLAFSRERSSFVQAFSILWGMVECVVAAYGAMVILARNGNWQDYQDCASLGTIFMSGMMVFEWLVCL